VCITELKSYAGDKLTHCRAKHVKTGFKGVATQKKSTLVFKVVAWDIGLKNSLLQENTQNANPQTVLAARKPMYTTY
jgi:hypothetical protein